MNTARGEATADASGRPAILHRWPSAVGLAAAVGSLATGVERKAVAVTICVAALCYLGAAALDKPWVAWAAIPGGSLVVVVSEVIGLVWWAGIGIAALALIAIGLLTKVSRPPLTAQTLALIGFGALAVVGVYVAPRAGLALAGVALASHSVWDVIHYRRDQVVPRSLAEFCVLLDVPLGAGAVILAILD
ncbi:hypothetical protein Acsp03_01450 [Actinomadura sp. NBRC 104412]|uniref:hypothetical protein n=1 Tax=Actinomadura sp. NBRC 104412 TaxID=3032203 RepID=UPI0024A2AB98|nr:hypothetical protein [Actinomadura sp. NBRC 104412]GLZ02678.1 hypothetical protein Acsp03_01450 [Actinomadura sp. NBRC 104412]